MWVYEIHSHASALHTFNFPPFAPDHAHFFQRTHDGADVFGRTSDPFGELVTRKQDFACILPEIEQDQIKSMADLVRAIIRR